MRWETARKQLLRDPLTHFVAVGGLVFVAFFIVGKDEIADPKTVVVDRAALLTFIQYRTKVFDPGVAAARLEGLSEVELKTLVDDYVREEVLHREARAMGLDTDDYVIRRRLVQKVEFIAEGFAGSAPPLSEEKLLKHFQDNKPDYYSPPVVTFTHVFLDAERRGWRDARKVGLETLEALRADDAAFSDATRYGDRFLYHVNYVERESDFIGSHFGTAMANTIFALPVSDDEWHGPIESPYGVHLLLLIRSVQGRVPEFAEVRARVAEDARRKRLRLLQDQALQAIIDSYEVEIEYLPAAGLIARSGNR